MGNSQTKPQRRNTDGMEEDLQYKTDYGAIPAHVVSQQLRGAPPPGTRTASGYPHRYENLEGPPEERYQNFESFITGPGNLKGKTTAKLTEYPIPTPGEPFHFRYDEDVVPARKMERQLHPNERANVMGAHDKLPRNDPVKTRAITRPSNAGGRAHNDVVGVVSHPPGSRTALQRAPIEPIDRSGRQAMQRHKDKDLSRVQTIPPRGYDAADMARFEHKYKRERRPSFPKMRK